MTDYFKDSVYGLCEETEFNNHIRLSFINGSLGPGSYSLCWLRSTYYYNSYYVASLDYGSVDYYYYDVYSGFSPACTIG